MESIGGWFASTVPLAVASLPQSVSQAMQGTFSTHFRGVFSPEQKINFYAAPYASVRSCYFSALSQKRLALAGMNPDLLPDGGADFGLDAFHEAHTKPLKFIGRSDGGGKLQCGLFHPAPAQMRSGVDDLDRVTRFGCFHNFGFVADSFNDMTILSGAVLTDCKIND